MQEKEAASNKLEELKAEYAKTRHNKATEKHIGILRAKIANLTKSLAAKKGRKGMGFAVRKTGDATVALVGFPNAGKSSLLTSITNADSKVANYAFTTLDAIPGMLSYGGAQIQVIDLPGMIEGAHIGKGGGAQIVSMIRVTDLLLFVVDIAKSENVYTLMDELNEFNIRINKPRPDIKIEDKKSGGILVERNGRKTPEPNVVRQILNEFDIFHAVVIFKQDATEDDLVDLLIENTVYLKGMIALNKIDTVSPAQITKISNELSSKTGMEVIPISASAGTNLLLLKERIFRNLKLMKIYLKPKDGQPDFAKPLILPSNSTVQSLAKALHTKIADNLRYALVNGKSVRFENQKVGPEHRLQDGDIVTLVYTKA